MVSQIITFMDIEDMTRRYEISLRVLTAQRTSEIFFKNFITFMVSKLLPLW